MTNDDGPIEMAYLLAAQGRIFAGWGYDGLARILLTLASIVGTGDESALSSIAAYTAAVAKEHIERLEDPAYQILTGDTDDAEE